MVNGACGLPKPLQYLFIGLYDFTRVELRPHGDTTGLCKLTRSLESLDGHLLIGSSDKEIRIDRGTIVGVRGYDCHIASRNWSNDCYSERSIISAVVRGCVGSSHREEFELWPIYWELGKI